MWQGLKRKKGSPQNHADLKFAEHLMDMIKGEVGKGAPLSQEVNALDVTGSRSLHELRVA